MDETAIFAQGDVFGVVEGIFDLPVASFQCQQLIGIGDVWWHAGNGILYLAVFGSLLLPGPFITDHLSKRGPFAVADEVCGGDEVASVVMTPVAVVDRSGLTAIIKWQGVRWRVE